MEKIHFDSFEEFYAFSLGLRPREPKEYEEKKKKKVKKDEVLQTD